MNRLLKQVAANPAGTGYYVNIPGWDMIAKTGTTSDYKDAYFIGGTPYGMGACWVGYENPRAYFQYGRLRACVAAGYGELSGGQIPDDL